MSSSKSDMVRSARRQSVFKDFVEGWVEVRDKLCYVLRRCGYQIELNQQYDDCGGKEVNTVDKVRVFLQDNLKFGILSVLRMSLGRKSPDSRRLGFRLFPVDVEDLKQIPDGSIFPSEIVLVRGVHGSDKRVVVEMLQIEINNILISINVSCNNDSDVDARYWHRAVADVIKFYTDMMKLNGIYTQIMFRAAVKLYSHRIRANDTGVRVSQDIDPLFYGFSRKWDIFIDQMYEVFSEGGASTGLINSWSEHVASDRTLLREVHDDTFDTVRKIVSASGRGGVLQFLIGMYDSLSSVYDKMKQKDESLRSLPDWKRLLFLSQMMTLVSHAKSVESLGVQMYNERGSFVHMFGFPNELLEAIRNDGDVSRKFLSDIVYTNPTPVLTGITGVNMVGVSARVSDECGIAGLKAEVWTEIEDLEHKTRMLKLR